MQSNGTATISVLHVQVLPNNQVAVKFQVLGASHANLFPDETVIAYSTSPAMAALEPGDELQVKITGTDHFLLAPRNSKVKPTRSPKPKSTL